MRHLTIRNVPTDLGKALEKEKKRRGASLNQTVLDVLREGLGVGPGASRSNGLGRLAGTWTEAERKRFDASVAVVEQIDADLWR